MLNYSNAFNCVVSNESDEVIIRFLQMIPQFNENNEIEKPIREEASSIVISKDMAASLANSILELINSPKEK